jgi:protein TonB
MVEPPAPKPFSFAAAAAAAAPAPAVEKAPEKKEQPKKIEPKQQGKWKPVPAPKQEEEAPAAGAGAKAEPKTEPKAQPKPEVASKPEPKPELKAEPTPVIAVPSFSYEAPNEEGKKSPMVIGGVIAALLVLGAGGYYMLGHKSSKAVPSPTTSSTQPAPSIPSSPTSTPTTEVPTSAATPTATAQPAVTTKPDAAKPALDKPKPQPTQIADTTAVSKPTPAPLIVAPSAARTQTADVAPPSISISGGAGPALDIPVTASAPKLSAPAPANAVIVPSRLLQRVNPTYPSSAKQYRIEGAVTLSATIAPDGHVREAKVISGPAMLRDAAVNAVKQWRYAPSTVNGRPVESSVQIVLQFKMPV